jgi:oxygen-independent coproporphyrinogen III oxidase
MQIKDRPGADSDSAIMTKDLLQKYDKLVPRYTSYPTAPHFSGEVAGPHYAEWLKALPADMPVSIYVHVPFCDTMCWFCGCNTKITRRYDPVEAYLETLLAEIDLIAETLGRKHPVNHIHWGGGSPTILAPEDTIRLAAHIGDRFSVNDETEFAVEIDPREVGADHLAALKQSGLTRASIGVQDINPIVQKAVNRIQPVEVTRGVLDGLRDLGVNAINMDLMYGLPHQDVAGMKRTVDAVLDMQPDRLALFGYAHVPWMKTHQKKIDEAVLPGRDDRHAMMMAAAERLCENGYRWIGLDHFAREGDALTRALDAGKLHRNFQGYTTDPCPALIGVGASSIGSMPEGYIQNHTPVNTWRTSVEKGGLPTAKGYALTREDRLRRRIIERLMCDLTVDVKAACEQADMTPNILLPSFDALHDAEQDGLCQIDGWRITIPENRRIFMRSVAVAFDQYLQAGAQRHSRAI